MLEDLVIALSLASFWFLQEWRPYLYPEIHHLRYLNGYSVGLLALILSVIALSLALWIVLRFLRRWEGRFLWGAGHLFLFMLVLSPLNYLRTVDHQAVHHPVLSVLFWKTHLGDKYLWTLAATGGLGVVVAFLKSARVIRWFREAMLVLAAFVVSTGVQSAYIFASVGVRGMSEFGKSAASPPVVVILFDELSQSLAEHAVRQGLMPEFERLRRESFVARNAHSPGDYTNLAVSIYLSGRRPKEIMLPPWASHEEYFSPERVAELREAGNIFQDAHLRGYRVSVTGFFLPYCHLFGKSLDACTDLSGVSPAPGITFTRRLKHIWERRLNNAFGENRIWVYKHLLRTTLDRVEEDRYTFLYVHWSIPHAPRVFDRVTGQLSGAADNSLSGYQDNLALVDRSLGNLRSALESTKLWDRAVVVLLSDHALHPPNVTWDCPRTKPECADRRVPLMIKFPTQKHGALYDGEVKLGGFRRIIQAILNRELVDPEGASSWFARLGK
ncbi:MAG: sulfatase-like hydrolase/transferase [Deltaproteobacteria bacterium]|nr:sulfatase-like hydrolase/transferase [Deltaproteobacteria bacterium]MBI3294239.1 sulfatase-like hydrolase/transferase [Deltaproteobacteria bacterium]